MSWAGPVVSIFGTLLSAKGQRKQGAAAQWAADIEASQLQRRAKQVKATSQRSAQEADRQGRLQQSRALAVAASSGGGASDPTIMNHMAQLAAESNYRKMISLYEGEEEAFQLEKQAEATKKGGGLARQAGNIGAAGTVLSSAGSLYSKYGQTNTGAGS